MIKEFELSRIKHTVNNVKELYLGDESACFGVFDESKRIIYIADNIKTSKVFFNQEDCIEDEELIPINEDVKEKTFYHELVHAILANMHQYDLFKDEFFVETFGNNLYEFMKTKK